MLTSVSILVVDSKLSCPRAKLISMAAELVQDRHYGSNTTFQNVTGIKSSFFLGDAWY